MAAFDNYPTTSPHYNGLVYGITWRTAETTGTTTQTTAYYWPEVWALDLRPSASTYTEKEDEFEIVLPKKRRPKLAAKFEEAIRKFEIQLYYHRLHLEKFKVPDHVLQIRTKPHNTKTTPPSPPVQRTFLLFHSRNDRRRPSQRCKSLTFRTKRAKKQESRKSQNPVAQCFRRNRTKRTRIFRSS